MKGFALGVIDDLRARQLWPVALLLVVALVAVPLFMLKPAEEVPPPAVAAAPTSSAVPGGLPGPEEALEAGSQPLVSLAVLNSPSDLENFTAKNPFKPLEDVASLDGDDALAGGDPTAASAGAGGAATDDGSSGGSGGGDIGSGGGGELPDLTDLPVAPPAPTPPPPSPTEPERQFVYAVDLTFDGGGPLRRYRNLPRLSMLPSAETPLLVFLGVSASGNSAVFLVDSTLQAQGGEGNCNPRPSECATLTIEPGEEQVFIDDQDRRYVIQIDQIRRRPLSGRAAAASDVRARTAEGDGDDEPLLRRFIPLLPDLLVTGGQE